VLEHGIDQLLLVGRFGFDDATLGSEQNHVGRGSQHTAFGLLGGGGEVLVHVAVGDEAVLVVVLDERAKNFVDPRNNFGRTLNLDFVAPGHDFTARKSSRNSTDILIIGPQELNQGDIFEGDDFFDQARKAGK
jgi:hypothetical protein